MPRRPRSHLPDGVYHVAVRGTGGIQIFVDDADRETFTTFLNRIASRFGWQLHAWCLMSTHYHLIVDASRVELSDGMHRLNGQYAQRFNQRHGRRGHLFEERFSSRLVRDEQHLRVSISVCA